MDPDDTPLSLEVQYGTLVAPTVTRGMTADWWLPTVTRGMTVNPGGFYCH